MNTSLLTRCARFAAVSLSVIAALTLTGGPAQAAIVPTLPASEHLFAMDCAQAPPKLWLVNESNATATTSNSSSPSNTTCVQSVAVDPRDGTPYVIYLDNLSFYLGSVDTSTGAIAQRAPISGAATYPEYLIITTSGDAFIAAAGSWYSLDLVTGATALIGSSGGWLMWVAYNATNDTISGFLQTSDDTADAFTIDRLTGAKTTDPSHNFVAPPGTPGCPGSPFSIYSGTGAAFDGSGNLWFLSDECGSTLFVGDFSTVTTFVQGKLTDATATHGSAPDYYIDPVAIFIAGDVRHAEPALPNTGADGSGPLSLGLLGSAFFAGGLTLMVVALVTRARRRRATD